MLNSDMGVRESRGTTTRRARSRPVIHHLPREQEYAFIRADLKRLLITAAIVTAVMLAMLVVFD